MDIDVTKALEITGIGLAGVFLFMTIFYFIIVGLDKLFPNFEIKKKLKNTNT